jgi:type VI secretion system secreted protein Hcp
MAAVDYFLKIEGIEGESEDQKHKGEIELESWSWGETQSGTHGSGGGGGAGKVVMQDFHFVTKINKASPKLFLHCANGKHITKATLVCRKAGEKQQEFLKITLSDLLVSSYQIGGSGHSDIVPTDQVSLNFTKIEYDYAAQKKDGSLDARSPVGWNIKENVKV